MEKFRVEEWVSESVRFDSTQHQLTDFYLRLHGLRQGPNADVFQVVKGQRNGPLDTLEEGGQGKRAEALWLNREDGAIGDGSKVACQLKRVQERPIMMCCGAFTRLIEEEISEDAGLKDRKKVSMSWILRGRGEKGPRKILEEPCSRREHGDRAGLYPEVRVFTSVLDRLKKFSS